ncbi:MAG: redoxin domain-containing protein [Planctomycetes bacterium]|nr:redoxin domain-containing protein [Planctomycetota bacterium]
MHRSLLALLPLLLVLAPQQHPKAPVVPKAVAERYSKLLDEWTTAFTPYSKAAAEARKNQQPAPESPHARFAARFAELARAGAPQAATWCLQFLSQTGGADAERRELFLAAEAKLVPFAIAEGEPQAAAITWPAVFGVREVLRAIGDSSELVGKERALALCEELFEKAFYPESKAQALQAQAGIHLTGLARDAATPEPALALYHRIVKDFSETQTAKRVAGQLFRLEFLTLGKTAPDFATEDVEGLAFKLSDYRGKVVVLDFWGFW